MAADLILDICQKIAERSALSSSEALGRLTRVRLTAIASASQAALIINSLEADAARSVHFYKACDSHIRSCKWMEFWEAERGQGGWGGG